MQSSVPTAAMLTSGHANMEELEIQLKKVPESAGCLIVTDGVFSMGGDIANLPEIVRLVLMLAVTFWMGALGIYYAVLAGLRFVLLRAIHRPSDQRGMLIYRRTGWLLNLLTLTMTGIFVQMVRENQAYDYPGVLIFAMAVWAFAKIIVAAVNLIKRQKDKNKVLAAARCVSFAGALMSILALQTALLARFGEGAVTFAQTMNAITGAGITALLITLSALMIARSGAWKNTDEKTLH